MVLVATAAAQKNGLTVEGLEGKAEIFTLQQLAQMPRQTVVVTDSHDNTKHRYEGVLLSLLLAKAGVPTGRTVHGPHMRDYVEVAGADNYRVIFALAELEPRFQDNKVIVADTLDGAPIDAAHGPLKLIAPQDQAPERWVYSLVAIRLRQAP
jgi:hypothetical protein